MQIKYLNRALSKTVGRALKTFPAVVITGPRQTGKTTLLKEEYGSRFQHASLEDPDVRALAFSDPRGFLRSHPPPCIFDEIQHVPDLLSFVKNAIDEKRSPGQWILTGSQSFPLMARVSQSLAGQAAILQLHGLSSVEIPPDLRLETPLELLRGSFPAWRRLLGSSAGKTIVACDCAEPRRLAPEVDAIPWRDVPTFLSGVFPT